MNYMATIKCGGNNPHNELFTLNGKNIPMTTYSTIICHGPSYQDIYNVLRRFASKKPTAEGYDIKVFAGKYTKSRGGKTFFDPGCFTEKVGGKLSVLASGGLCLAISSVIAKNHYFVALTRTNRKEFVRHQQSCTEILSVSDQTSLGMVAAALESKVMGKKSIDIGSLVDAGLTIAEEAILN